MLKIGIISNPYARMNRLHPEYNTRLWYALGQYGQLELTHSHEDLKQVCEEFCAKGINLVGIFGGDGSLSLVLSALWKAYAGKELPKILLLKGGTINFLASNLGIKTEALPCLQATLKRVEQNQSLYEITLRTLHVNGRLGFIFANGIAATFLDEYYKNKTNSVGAFAKACAYLMDGLFCGKINGGFKKIMKRQDMKITTYPVPLWSEKKKPLLKIPDKYALIFASTVPDLPFCKRFFKKIQLGDSAAEVIAIAETNAQILKGALRVLRRGSIYDVPLVSSVKAQRTVITCEKNSAYSMDGDLLTTQTGEINIEMGPSFVFCSPYKILKDSNNGS